MKNLTNNTYLKESLKHLREQKQETYLMGTPYVVTYIDTEGKTQNANYTPDKDMNIVEIISKFKEENENFFKLYSIVKDMKESLRQEYDLQSDVLTEVVDIKSDMSEEDFKSYIEDEFSGYKDYIKLFKVSKQNKSNQWGVYIYGLDIDTPNGVKLNGIKWYIPYDNDFENFVNPLIDITKKEIVQFYNDNGLILEGKNLKEEYIPNSYGFKCPKCGSNYYVEMDEEEDEDGTQHIVLQCQDCGFEEKDEYTLEEVKHLKENYKVYTTDYNDDGTTTKELYMSFDTFKEAERARQGLQDKGIDAWIEELKENKKITEAYEVHNELNPKLWNNETKELLPEVQEALEDIAEEFIKYIDIPLEVVDVEFVGSNASYNYNDKSDIDLHLIVNFDINYVDDEILQTLYNAKKNSFNDNYDLEIKGIPVEIYVEDIKAGNSTLAIYSVQDKKWIKEPQPITYELPDVTEELNKRHKEIDTVLNGTDEQAVKDLLNDIYMERKNGLAVDGEASVGNVVFKELRNEGFLDGLRNKYYELRSEQLSVNESKI